MTPDDDGPGRFATPQPPPPEILAGGPQLIDSHAHLDLLPDLNDVLARAKAAGVERIVTIGVDPASNEWAVATAHERPEVWATVGLHPHDAKLFSRDVAGEIERQASEECVLGVGEAGLDYFYDHSPRETQREVFAWHVRLARRTGKALVIHTRDAWEDLFAILEYEGAPGRVVFHCWSGGPAEAQRALEMGAVLSFSGTVTFKNAEELRRAALITPLDRLTVETDAPFLTPSPYRGRRNEPAYVGVTAGFLAELKEVTPERLAGAARATAEAVFGLG